MYFGKCWVPPSPKFQVQLIGLLTDVSVKFTVNAPYPLVGLALNPADGGSSVTNILPKAVLVPYILLTINLTV